MPDLVAVWPCHFTLPLPTPVYKFRDIFTTYPTLDKHFNHLEWDHSVECGVSLAVWILLICRGVQERDSGP